MKNKTSNCSGNHFCKRWKTCDRCARIRAAAIADRAEYLEHRFGKLALAVAKPEDNTARSIRALRDKIMRAKIAPAGIWTVETGDMFAGLHLNLLLPAESIPAAIGHTEYIEPLRESARCAAAYISKRTGMPLPHQYEGRLMGEWGNCMQHLMRGTSLQAAPSQAAALAMALAALRTIANYYKSNAEIERLALQSSQKPKEKTREEYAEIMRRNLTSIYLALNKHHEGHAL